MHHGGLRFCIPYHINLGNPRYKTNTHIVRDFEKWKSACEYGWWDVKKNRYCFSNFLFKIAGCYLIVGGGEGEIKWIKAHSSRLHCHSAILFCYREMNSVTRIEKFLEKPLIGEVGRWEKKNLWLFSIQIHFCD